MIVARTAPIPRRMNPPREAGSVLLLTLGYAVLALALVFVCVDATSLYIAQKRLDAAADAAVLAGADGFTLVIDGGVASAQLTDEAVRSQAEAVLDVLGTARVVAATSPDGATACVTVEADWHPPLLSMLVPEGWVLQSTATSRTALR